MKQTRSYTKNDVLKAVEGCSGIISTVAGRLGCDWHTAKENNRPITSGCLE